MITGEEHEANMFVIQRWEVLQITDFNLTTCYLQVNEVLMNLMSSQIEHMSKSSFLVFSYTFSLV